MSKRKIGINFGAWAEPISKQLSKQGITLPEPDTNRYQMCSDAITLLAVQGLLMESQTELARKRLLKRICGVIK
jgi:hypothetical protein